MKWNQELKRFESDRVHKEKWVYPEDEFLDEGPPVRFCRIHEPPEWKLYRDWLQDYGKKSRNSLRQPE